MLTCLDSRQLTAMRYHTETEHAFLLQRPDPNKVRLLLHGLLRCRTENNGLDRILRVVAIHLLARQRHHGLEQPKFE